MRLITIATFTFSAQAQLIKVLLEGEGIICHVANEHVAYPIELQGPEEAAEAAQEVLGNVEPPQEEEEVQPSLLTVATVDNPLDAHMATARLDEAGITHSIVGEGDFGLGRQSAVLVSEEVIEEALDILQSF